ncbi:MAG TPA: SAM-dependent methyltransferase [Candidatus Binatia bacterium]|nr:SAM-dependent methyltransferase [Candidatus Binatia bacterium]
MREGRPSRTAELMALFRALETVRPARTRLFEDPLAAQFLGALFRTVLLLGRLPGGVDAITWIIERRWGGPLGSGVCRTRYIDDALSAAVRGGVEQVVLLGAGFDARPYRLAGIERARVFEVDHPATQAVKRARLAGAIPRHVTFVPVDFARDRLDDAMAAGGFRRDRRTFFLWEGVTNYLDAAAVDATLGWIAAAGGPGSELLFTYVDRAMLDGSRAFEGAAEGRATVGRFGEPFTFGLDPATIDAYLAARGLDLVEDVAAPDYRTRYLRPLGRTLKLWEFYRAARARVGAVRVERVAGGELSRCRAIRREVFVEEQGVPLAEEMDAHDATAVHFLALVDDAPIGTARLRITGEGAAKAERVAVLARFRRRRAGVALMAAVEDAARAEGHGEMVLNAQVPVVGFYERLGYRAEGPEFVEAGIPHRAMRKRLS